MKKKRNDEMTEVLMDELDDTEAIVIDNVVENTGSISTKLRHVQSSLDTFVGTASKEKEREIDVDLDKRSLDYIAEKLAERFNHSPEIAFAEFFP